jgi:hypothetical protein
MSIPSDWADAGANSKNQMLVFHSDKRNLVLVNSINSAFYRVENAAFNFQQLREDDVLKQ